MNINFNAIAKENNHIIVETLLQCHGVHVTFSEILIVSKKIEQISFISETIT